MVTLNDLSTNKHSKKSKKMTKDEKMVDATDAGNGSDYCSDSESWLETEEEELLDDDDNELIERKSVRHLVSTEMIVHKEKLKNLPDLDCSPRTISKYKMVLDGIFDRFPTFKKTVLNDFNIDSIKDVTMLLVAYNKESTIFFYRYLADSIERILMTKTRDIRNELGRPTLKEINQYIEDHYDASEEIINYFKGFRKNRKVLKSSERERNIERLISTTDKHIVLFFRTLEPHYFHEYALFIDYSSEDNVEVLGRQLNEQFQAYRKDPSKGAASMEQTYIKMRDYAAFTEPSKVNINKTKKKSNQHGFRKNQSAESIN